MGEEQRINRQILIMVIIVIMLIICLMGILLFYVYDSKKLSVDSTTTSKETIKNEPSIIVNDKETIAENTIKQYLNKLQDSNKIGEYQIMDINLLGKNEMCPSTVYDDKKIYVNFRIDYKQVDDTFAISGNDNNSDNEDKSIFSSNGTYVINNIDGIYEIENMYTGC